MSNDIHYRVYRKSILDRTILDRNAGVFYQVEKQFSPGEWKADWKSDLDFVARYLWSEANHLTIPRSILGLIHFDFLPHLEWSEKDDVFISCEPLSEAERIKLGSALAFLGRGRSDAADYNRNRKGSTSRAA